MNSFVHHPIPDGTLAIWDHFLNPSDADQLQRELIEQTSWQQEEIVLFGKRHKQPRLTAWYGCGMSAESKYTRPIPAHPWTEFLDQIKTQVEGAAQHTFNSCLVNYYRNGQDAMGFHADNEACLGGTPTIASLSVGASRKFVLKHRTAAHKVEIMTGHGQLILMAGPLQQHWIHGVNRSKRVHDPRVNLTFRHLLAV